MSLTEKIAAEMLALCPDFQPWWDDERTLWADDDGPLGVHAVFAAFSHFIADQLPRRPTAELSPVFEYVESKLGAKDSVVASAAATCFLENLMNRVPGTLAPGLFVPLLGPRSRKFCRRWDEFRGMRTEGLH
jgi:hypothetical protein